MKKRQSNSTRAWALHVALSLVLLSISAVLLASSFKAGPATRGLSAPIKPGAAGNKEGTTGRSASISSLPALDARSHLATPAASSPPPTRRFLQISVGKSWIKMTEGNNK